MASSFKLLSLCIRVHHVLKQTMISEEGGRGTTTKTSWSGVAKGYGWRQVEKVGVVGEAGQKWLLLRRRRQGEGANGCSGAAGGETHWDVGVVDGKACGGTARAGRAGVGVLPFVGGDDDGRILARPLNALLHSTHSSGAPVVASAARMASMYNHTPFI